MCRTRLQCLAPGKGIALPTPVNDERTYELQSAISLLVCLGFPFGKQCKRVTGPDSLVEQDAILGQPIAQGVAGLQLQPLAHCARNRGPAFGRDLRECGRLAADALHTLSLFAVLPLSSRETSLRGPKIRYSGQNTRGAV